MKYYYILLFLLIISELNASPENPPFSLNNSSSFNELSKPRPKFRKSLFAYNTFFVEGGFVGGYYNAQKYSLNYDFVGQTDEFLALTLRVGFEKQRMTSGSDRMQVPFYVNLLVNRKNSWELSGGAYYDLTNNKINPSFATGFRHQSPKGGFFFRLSFFLTTEKEIDEIQKLELKRIWIYGGLLGLGWSF